MALNQVQVIGSHNSYHIQPDPLLIDLYLLFDETAIQLEYTHRPLDEQFEHLGIRQIELDVYADPEGGLYAAPFGFQLLQKDFTARIPDLEAPGIKVLHVQELDYDTTCQFLVECLTVVKVWSNASPGHLPIMILIEAKDDLVDPLDLGFTIPIEFGPAEFDELDAEIRSVFPPEQIITPDDVRRGAPTLEKAVQTRGWPTLSEARGRILFALDNGGAKREAYLEGHPSLTGRVLFTNSTPGQADAAFVKVNEPLSDPERIPEPRPDLSIHHTAMPLGWAERPARSKSPPPRPDSPTDLGRVAGIVWAEQPCGEVRPTVVFAFREETYASGVHTASLVLESVELNPEGARARLPVPD